MNIKEFIANVIVISSNLNTEFIQFLFTHGAFCTCRRTQYIQVAFKRSVAVNMLFPLQQYI